MPRFLNKRQEKFCLLYFGAQGTNTPAYDCAIQAGYAARAARPIASRLLATPSIQERINELRKKAEDAMVADVVERKKVATEIVRGRLADFINEKGEVEIDKAKLKSAAFSKLKVTTVSIGEAAIEKTITLEIRNPLDGVDVLNKMENVYKQDAPISIEHRTLIINVIDPGAKDLIGQIKDRKF